jgi:hypothetical protein
MFRLMKYLLSMSNKPEKKEAEWSLEQKKFYLKRALWELKKVEGYYPHMLRYVAQEGRDSYPLFRGKPEDYESFLNTPYKRCYWDGSAYIDDDTWDGVVVENKNEGGIRYHYCYPHVKITEDDWVREYDNAIRLTGRGRVIRDNYETKDVDIKSMIDEIMEIRGRLAGKI